MRVRQTFRTQRPIGALALVGIAAVAAAAAVSVNPVVPKFFSDDPIVREPAPKDASHVESFPIHLSWDIISSLFAKEGNRTIQPAQDVNTIGEVPDSSWFVNRAGSMALTASDVARGPDTTDGPSGIWTIVSGKSEGVRPGFTIVDSKDVRWFLKLDAPGYPEQATSAEVVSTKLFWAAGYHVAETHVARLRRENLVLDEAATITINGKKRRLTNQDVQRVLSLSERSPDGSYRVLASKQLEGKPVGEFLYYGTRSDDPNDVIPHENRRSLRGMLLFAAWIDRVDAKAGNTLDTLVQENGKTVVRHHVLDFGSTMGSGGIAPNEYWEGYDYLYSGSSLWRRMAGLGFPVANWRRISYPSITGVARIEGDHFDPEQWKSRVPNAAYTRADAEDKFWAATKLMAIDDEMIAAAVHSGNYSDPAAERYLTETLIKRRDALLRVYLPKAAPLVHPALDASGRLAFENAAARLVPPGSTSFEASWYLFDNASGESTPIGQSRSLASPHLDAPAPLPDSANIFVRVDVRFLNNSYRNWEDPVQLYFHRTADTWKLVGQYRTAAADGVPSAAGSVPQAIPQKTPASPVSAPEKIGVQLSQTTSLHSLVHDTLQDVKHLPSLQSLLIASVGGAAALAVHPADKSVNSHLSGHNDLFAPGAVIGNTGTLVGAAFGTWGFGKMLGSHDASHLGLDGLRAIGLSEMMLQSLKYTVRRERPDHSSGYSFPSGHSADTFALATVIERHAGFGWSLIGYAAASYVAMSRLHDNVHYLSDVVFGAAVGSIAGTTITRHGRSNYALIPFSEPGGGGLALLYTGH
jgi:hypothetical protein